MRDCSMNVLSNGSRRLLNGQSDENGCAVSHARFDADRATVGFNNASNNGQAQPGTRGFGGAQDSGEGALLQLGTHALASILEFNGDMSRLGVRAWQANRL